MMTMQSASAIAGKRPKPSVSFQFEKNDKKPKGFDDLSINENVTVTVKGKVIGLNHDEWGSSMRIQIGELMFGQPKIRLKGR